jgi:hypothetical protein
MAGGRRGAVGRHSLDVAPSPCYSGKMDRLNILDGRPVVLTRELGEAFAAVEGMQASDRVRQVVEALGGSDMTSADRRSYVKATLAAK